jgi:hypothetical protein
VYLQYSSRLSVQKTTIRRCTTCAFVLLSVAVYRQSHTIRLSR